MLQQTKILPASQVQNNFGDIVKQVRNGDVSEVIVENRGKPIVAIVDMVELKEIQAFREQVKRKKALETLRALRAKIQSRTKSKLSEDEAQEIADRFSREIIEDLEKQGKVRFEQKSS